MDSKLDFGDRSSWFEPVGSHGLEKLLERLLRSVFASITMSVTLSLLVKIAI